MQNNDKNKKGSAVAYALVIISMVSLILASIVQFVGNQAKNAYRTQAREEAFQVAESGVNFFRWYLAHETDGKTTEQIKNFWLNTSPYPLGVHEDYQKALVDKQGGEIGKFSIHVPGPIDTSSSIINVEVTGWTNKYPNVKRKIRIRLRRPSWSDYSILTDEVLKFKSGWKVKGRIMSNTGVHFDGVANNTVYAGLDTYYDTDEKKDMPGVWTSWANEYNTDEGSNVFLGGKEYPFPQKDFNGITTSLDLIKNISMAPGGATVNGCTPGGCHFTVNTAGGQLGKHIILKPDGTFDLRTVTAIKGGANTNTIKNESSSTTYSIPNGGAIFIEGDAWVEGTINNSKVTIVTANLPSAGTDANMYIGLGHIKYTNFDGKDVIGLISQGNIEMLHDGLDNLRIDAAILAQNGNLGQKDHNPNCCSLVCAGLKNSVVFFGSIASKKNIEMLIDRKKCSENNEKFYGYVSSSIDYDNNLLYHPPPYFPTSVQYFVDLWEEM